MELKKAYLSVLILAFAGVSCLGGKQDGKADLGAETAFVRVAAAQDRELELALDDGQRPFVVLAFDAPQAKDFVERAIDRYGIGEVLRWYFEISGEGEEFLPRYESVALALKEVDGRLWVGCRVSPDGRGAGIGIVELTAYCTDKALPVDFVSVDPTGVDISRKIDTLAEFVKGTAYKNMEIHCIGAKPGKTTE